MIYRTVKDRDNYYVKLNTTAINDPRLSFKAVGIHAYIMAKPDGWEARESDMVQRHADGLASVRSGVKELIEYGYMVRVRIINERKQVVGWRIDTYETPALNPHYVADAEQPPHVDEPDCENLNLDTATGEKPDCGFPDLENPQVENRNHSNNVYTTTIESSNDRTYGANAPAQAPASAASLASQFRNFHDELKTSNNRIAVLRRAYVHCYGEHDAPDFGRIGAFAKRVGGAGMALELIWSTISRPPNGNVLDYLEATFNARRDRRQGGAKPSKVANSMAAVDRLFARIEEAQNADSTDPEAAIRMLSQRAG